MLNKLSRLLDQAGISLTDHQKNQLVAYVDMLNKWNKAYNLTSVRDPNEMLVCRVFRCRLFALRAISRCWTALANACAFYARYSMS